MMFADLTRKESKFTARISGVRIVTAEADGGEGSASLYIRNGRISEPFAGPYDIDLTAADFADGASELFLLPGLVDAHCHLRDPGFTYREDIESGSRAAVRGGFTAVMCMPNTKPCCDNATVVSYIVHKAANVALCRIYPIGAVTKDRAGDSLAEMGSMKQAGVVALSDDGATVANADILLRALRYADQFDLPLIDHCEDMSMPGAMNEGWVSTSLGVIGQPSIAEDIIVARDLLVAEYAQVPIHLAHISTARSVELIRQAKARGVAVTCETCPHYFILTEEICRDFNPQARVNPPLRSETDCLAIIEGLKDGTIDIIATDHAPHHADEKNRPFSEANMGISGLETAFALSYTYLVEAGHLTLSDLVRLMSTTPSDIFKLSGGSLAVGSPADFTIVDPNRKDVVRAADFVSKGKNTPFEGYPIFGEILATFVDGKQVYNARGNR